MHSAYRRIFTQYLVHIYQTPPNVFKMHVVWAYICLLKTNISFHTLSQKSNSLYCGF